MIYEHGTPAGVRTNCTVVDDTVLFRQLFRQTH